MSGAEGSLQVLNAGTGAVRTVTITTLVNGVATDVQMQVLGIADNEGRMVRLEDLMLSTAILNSLERLNEKLELLLTQL